MRRLRRAVLPALVAVVAALALDGCSVIGAVDDVRTAATEAADLAKTLDAAPGVRSAAARYDAVDANGEIVFVRVDLAPDASAAQWGAVEDLITTRLDSGGLQRVRQVVRLTTTGTSPARMQYGSATDWRSRPRLSSEVRRWTALRAAVGVPMGMTRAAGTGTAVVFRVVSRADSQTFMHRSGAIAARLAGVSVNGYGFSGFGPAPTGTASAYRRMLAVHPALKDGGASPQALPAAGLVWWDRSWRVTVVAPGRATAPSRADEGLLTGLQRLRARHVSGSFLWVNGAVSAGVEFSACRRSRLVTGEHDLALAAALAHAGHPLVGTARAGSCT